MQSFVASCQLQVATFNGSIFLSFWNRGRNFFYISLIVKKEWAIHLLGHILTGDLKPQISGQKNIDKIIDQYSLDRWKIGLNGG